MCSSEGIAMMPVLLQVADTACLVLSEVILRRLDTADGPWAPDMPAPSHCQHQSQRWKSSHENCLQRSETQHISASCQEERKTDEEKRCTTKSATS